MAEKCSLTVVGDGVVVEPCGTATNCAPAQEAGGNELFKLFSRRIVIESRVVHPGGFFASGVRPALGAPLAEIYALADASEAIAAWWLIAQEKLSRRVRWPDDYFQICAETLAFGHAGGSILATPCWVVVAFDAAGRAVASVDYWPLYANGVVDDVGYAESTDMRLNSG